ncbi:major facilitator superfamily domain-containing protein [Pelagophyceae sp. CCMP2097]|nr:major facilitator superfamily domain-containing protein [Pelagophyceae sp. CCMP2097]
MGTGYGGLWLLLRHAAEWKGRQEGFGLVLLCCFIYGHGSSYLDVATIATVVRAFPNHRGAVVGLLKSGYGLSSSLVVLFAGYVVSQQSFVAVLALVSCGLAASGARHLSGGGAVKANFRPRDSAAVHLAASRRIDRATLRVLAVAAVVLAVAVARVLAPDFWKLGWPNVGASLLAASMLAWQLTVLRDGPKAETDDGASLESPMLGDSSAQYGDAAEAEAPAKMLAGTVDSSPKETLRRPEYWLDMCATFPAAGMGLLVINNLAQIMSARGASTATQKVAVSLVSVANCLGRLLTGRLADAVVKRHLPRPVLLAVANLGGCAAMALMYASEGVGAAFCGILIAGLFYGMLWTLIPTLVADLFGERNFGSNYALCLPAVIAGSVFFSTYLAGETYAAHSQAPADDGAAECHGRGCFGDAFLGSAISCAAGAAAAVALAWKSRNLYAAPLADAALYDTGEHCQREVY